MSASVLQRSRELLTDDLLVVEGIMAESMESRAETISRASRHLLTSGGKRVRAILCLHAGHATGTARQLSRRLACCAELIHAASLCHDDVLDGGDLRRGKPTIRAVFGDPLAILLGDYCLARAFQLMSDHALCRAASAAAGVVTAMTEGEVVQAERSWTPHDELDRYFAVAAAKTGALLTWSATLGGLVPEPYLPALATYGQMLGRIYQIADDLLDFNTGDLTGKASGQDLVGGGNSLPLLLACAARPELRSRVEEMRAARAADPGELASLTAAIRATGALETARTRALAEAESATEAIAVLPDSPHRAMLGELARFAADRHA